MTITTTTLATALTGCASRLYPLEAGVALLIAEGTSLNRDDFTSRFIEHDAAITALSNGELPCSAGERHVLAAAASIAAGIPVDLRHRHRPRRTQHSLASHRHQPHSRGTATTRRET